MNERLALIHKLIDLVENKSKEYLTDDFLETITRILHSSKVMEYRKATTDSPLASEMLKIEQFADFLALVNPKGNFTEYEKFVVVNIGLKLGFRPECIHRILNEMPVKGTTDVKDDQIGRIFKSYYN